MRRKRDRLRPRRNTSATIEPGRLLDLVPRLSRQLHRPDHLAPLAEKLELGLEQTIEVCFSVPPRHGKTTLLVHAIVWILLKDPTATILYVSYAHDFAAKQVRKAMQLALRAGVHLGDVRRQDEWTTAAGGGVKAAGVDGQITGEGFRVIFVDDPHKNRAEAESLKKREGVVEGFNDNVYTRQDPRGTSIYVVHTRWHERDLTGQLTHPDGGDDPEDRPEPFEVISLPALDRAGRPLAPRLFNVTRLRRIERRLGPYSWASLYQGSPRPRGGALFSDVTLYDDDGSEAGAYTDAIGVDLTHTSRTRSDWNAVVVMRRFHATGTIRVVRALRRRGVLTDRKIDGAIDEGFARDLVAIQTAHPGARCVSFTGGNEELVLLLLAQLKQHACYIEAWPVGSRDKWTRSQSYAAAWNAGRVQVRANAAAAWASDFIAEHHGFTGIKGDVDDQVDAATAAFEALSSSPGVLVTSNSSPARNGATEPLRRLNPRRRYS